MPLNNVLICTKQPYLSAHLYGELKFIAMLDTLLTYWETTIAIPEVLLAYETPQHHPILLDSAKHAKITIGVIYITYGAFIAKKSLMKNSQPH